MWRVRQQILVKSWWVSKTNMWQHASQCSNIRRHELACLVCMATRIWGSESPSVREKARERSWAVSTKDGDVVTRAEETTEFATEEEPAEEVANKSNIVVALLLVDRPESWFITTRRKSSQRSGENEQRNCNIDLFTGNCLGDELPHYKTPENASCMYAMLRSTSTWNSDTCTCVDTADLQGNASTDCCLLC